MFSELFRKSFESFGLMKMNRITLLKLADKTIGKSLVYILPRIRGRNTREMPAEVKKILIIRPGGIGDAVLLLPAIRVLKGQFPGSEIEVLCEKRNTGIFRLSSDINRLYMYDEGFGLIKCLRNRYDVIVDTEQWHRLSAVVAFVTGAPLRVGFDTNERRRLLTKGVSYNLNDYEVCSFFNLLRPLIDKVPAFSTNEPFIDVQRDPSLEQSYGLAGKRRIVFVFPGTSVAEKRWGGERYGEVAAALLKKGYTVVVIGSPAEAKDAETIKKHANGCIDLTGKTSLQEVAVLLKAGALLITADTGIMHLAYGVGTSTVSLFGPSKESKWAPQGKGHVVLNKGLACGPCTTFGYTPPCDRNVECMSLIRTDEVIEAAEKLLLETS